MSSGHQREAARRRRAHPKGSARTGEGARGGAVLSFLRPPWTADAGAQSLGCGAEREGEGETEPRVSGGERPGRFLSGRKARRAVDRRWTATSEWASAAAQAGKGARPISRPRPRLRPGRGGALARAAGPRVAGPVALRWAEIAEQ